MINVRQYIGVHELHVRPRVLSSDRPIVDTKQVIFEEEPSRDPMWRS